MAFPIATGTAVSTSANTKSADLITGTGQYVPKGKLTLVAKGSATGMNVSLACNGTAIIDDLAIVSTGTAGTISTNDNVVASQLVNGGRVQMFLRNTTGGSLTTDYLLLFEPSK